MKKICCFIIICLEFTYCNNYEIDDIKNIEGAWEVYSVSSKDEVFYPKGKSPLFDYYTFNSDSTGIKKKLKPNLDKTFSSSFDEIIFKINVVNDVVYLNYISKTNSWKERIIKLTSKDLIISNNRFQYNYKRVEIN
tara:strand:- start:22472 stop:22879 length:408 start_codon:yes stop_codon:yes gene_type:complete